MTSDATTAPRMLSSEATTGAATGSSSRWRPRAAMVLAAGFGTRMRPLTETRPKPLIEVLGQSMLDRILDKLKAEGVERIVVNAHYLPDHVAAALERRGDPALALSREDAILDTGGGVMNALDHLGAEPFYVVNGDVFWLEGASPALARLAERWDHAAMDALLLMEPTVRAIGFEGPGDYLMAGDGKLSRRLQHQVAPFAYAGVQILHPRLFQNPVLPRGEAFSLNRIYDAAEEAERLFGLRHDGLWFHIGTPDDLALAEAELGDLGFQSMEEIRAEEAARR